MNKLHAAGDLKKSEAGAVQKRLAALNSKDYLTDDEVILRDTLISKLADNASDAAFEKALKGPRFALNTI
jgi:hypothetical protein